ncbi:MAG: OmpH family outer membrane protein [Sphingobacteriaceae bacterium]
MKTLSKVALVAVCFLFVGNFAKAQAKIAHINFNQLIDAMPETKTIQKQIQDYQKQFVDQLTTMNTELQTKAQDYDAKKASMTDASKTAKENELQDINKRLQEYQNTAQQKVQEKTNELSKPLLDKARATITALAKEKGYGYVIDTSQTELLVSPPADDLLALTKTKLGLK